MRARSGANTDIAEYLMGHTIDPLGYNQISRDVEYAKKEYLQALPYLNILDKPPSEINKETILQNRITELETIIRELKKST